MSTDGSKVPELTEFEVSGVDDVWSPGVAYEVKCFLPPGIEVRTNGDGHAVCAAKEFAVGDIVYATTSYFLPESMLVGDIRQRFIPHGESEDSEDCVELTINPVKHAVRKWVDGRWMREVCLFDSFIDHSCETNTIDTSSRPFDTKVHSALCTPATWFTVDRKNGGKLSAMPPVGMMWYLMIACRPILPGDQITGDYAQFEYDCEDKGIDSCLCDAKSCIGSMWGFGFLSEKEQLRRIHIIDIPVMAKLREVRPGLVYFDTADQLSDEVTVRVGRYSFTRETLLPHHPAGKYPPCLDASVQLRLKHAADYVGAQKLQDDPECAAVSVLASSRIEAGSTVLCYDAVQASELTELIVRVGRVNRKLDIDAHVMSHDGSWYLLGIAGFLGGSFESNVEVTIEGGKIMVVATRAIESGEQLCVGDVDES